MIGCKHRKELVKTYCNENQSNSCKYNEIPCKEDNFNDKIVCQVLKEEIDERLICIVNYTNTLGYLDNAERSKNQCNRIVDFCILTSKSEESNKKIMQLK